MLTLQFDPPSGTITPPLPRYGLPHVPHKLKLLGLITFAVAGVLKEATQSAETMGSERTFKVLRQIISWFLLKCV